ncbi:MAG: hypothetical protein ACPHY8_01130 [Patescibacteria group bacterium]
MHKEIIHSNIFDEKPLFKQENRDSNTKSYFLSIIIFTKKPAKRISFLLAFCSSFLVLFIQAAHLLIDSCIFSDTSAEFEDDSGDSEGVKVSKSICNY